MLLLNVGGTRAENEDMARTFKLSTNITHIGGDRNKLTLREILERLKAVRGSLIHYLPASSLTLSAAYSSMLTWTNN